MILSKFAHIKISRTNLEHFKSLGYKNLKFFQPIRVPIKHLKEKSPIKIKVKCDICGKEKELSYVKYLKNTKNNTIKYTCSNKCAHIAGKNKKTKLKNHGDENYHNVEQMKQTKLKNHGDPNYVNPEKAKETKKKKYGNENYNNRKKANETCLEKYGVDHPSQSKIVRNKYKQTMLQNYGIEHNWSGKYGTRTCDKTKKNKYGDINYNNTEKREKTMMERYNVAHPSQSKELFNKGKQIKKKKYGDPNYNNPEKRKQTNLKKYGKNYYPQTEEFSIKFKNIMINKYGVEHYSKTKDYIIKFKNTSNKRYETNHPMQNIEIFNKCLLSNFKLKNYILPSGKVVKVQGYEPLSLNILFKAGYKEIDLLIEDKEIENKIGKIWYIGKDNKKHRYYPDIYIISENKIIEVKSNYLYKRDINKNLLKNQACLDMNMKFEFMVFDKHEQHLLNFKF